MKTRIAALALLLAAGAAPAAVAHQDDQRGPDHRDRSEQARPADRAAGGWHGEGAQRPPAQAAAPPRALAAPSAPQAQSAPTGAWAADPRWSRDRAPAPPPASSPQGHGMPDRDRARPRDWDHRDGDHRDWTRDHRDWDRDHRDWDRHGRPEWRPGAYPHSFRSDHRFYWRPYRRPPHFFFHIWTFGEILPPAWYGPEWIITDWWNFDLPAPPPGYDWVRVGDDALLIDEYSGRVVQVVRYLFW